MPAAGWQDRFCQMGSAAAGKRRHGNITGSDSAACVRQHGQPGRRKEGRCRRLSGPISRADQPRPQQAGKSRERFPGQLQWGYRSARQISCLTDSVVESCHTLLIAESARKKGTKVRRSTCRARFLSHGEGIKRALLFLLSDPLMQVRIVTDTFEGPASPLNLLPSAASLNPWCISEP